MIGIGISPMFRRGSSGSTPAPSVLQTWYDSLSVKPSAGLWSDLKTMADGMNSDGDWSEMDFMSMIACMETDEQRLRPLKTSSGLDMIVVGSPTLNTSGARNPTSGVNNYLNTKWNPATNGVKYTLNSAFMAIYGDTNIAGTSSGFQFGSSDINSTINVSIMRIVSATTNVQLGTQTYLNDTSSAAATLKTLVSGAKRYFATVKRTGSLSRTKYINGVTSSTAPASTTIPPYEFYLLGINYENTLPDIYSGHILRSAICGSSLIDSSRVQARLQTFFTARGLTITNF